MPRSETLVLIVSLFYICFASSTSRKDEATEMNTKPHIIYILADDMGWNDVSFRGNDQIPTPNIDALAYNGVILNRHYTQPLCTPSRASLMTGKYAVHTGLHDAFAPTHKAGLPLSEKILPQHLKELGYKTHLVGKWHLGFYRKEYTPLQRGFDSHFGYWSGAISYYDHIDENPLTPNSRLNYSGHDMRRSYASACDIVGEYATDLFTKEAVSLIEKHPTDQPMFMLLAHLATHAGNQGKWLEAPQQVINKFSYISNPNRRTYAAMVSKLDESVGEVVSALDKRGMLKNSIIVFLSDNGAPNIGLYNNWGSNYPWRGEKATLWEGAVRTPSLIWSPLIAKPSRVSHNLMHVSDWLPTLLTAAGRKGAISGIDGIDQWEAISKGRLLPRHELVVDIDDEKKMIAVVFRSFKYIKGPIRPTDSPERNKFLNTETINSPKQPEYDINEVYSSLTWQATHKYTSKPISQFKIPELRKEATIVCDHDFNKELNCSDQPCLFNIFDDPCEQNNVASDFPQLVSYIERVRLNEYREGAIVVPIVEDPASDPERFNGDWSIWVE